MTTPNAIQKLVAAGLSRGQIAAATHSTRAAVSHWERGRSTPSGKKLAALGELAAAHNVALYATDFGRAPTSEEGDRDAA